MAFTEDHINQLAGFFWTQIKKQKEVQDKLKHQNYWDVLSARGEPNYTQEDKQLISWLNRELTEYIRNLDDPGNRLHFNQSVLNTRVFYTLLAKKSLFIPDCTVSLSRKGNLVIRDWHNDKLLQTYLPTVRFPTIKPTEEELAAELESRRAAEYAFKHVEEVSMGSEKLDEESDKSDKELKNELDRLFAEFHDEEAAQASDEGSDIESEEEIERFRIDLQKLQLDQNPRGKHRLEVTEAFQLSDPPPLLHNFSLKKQASLRQSKSKPESPVQKNDSRYQKQSHRQPRYTALLRHEPPERSKRKPR